MNAARMAFPRDGDDISGLRNPGGDKDPQAGEHIELAQKAARPVVSDHPFLAVDRQNDVDLRRNEDEEVVGEVALLVEVLTPVDVTPAA
jgi:hypothetical protein